MEKFFRLLIYLKSELCILHSENSIDIFNCILLIKKNTSI